MRNKVYIVHCPNYEQVIEKMTELLKLAGGMEQFVHKDEKIVLKPNLLMAAAPEKHVSTHPAVVAAVGKLVKRIGAKTVIIDSAGSGYPHNKKTFERVYNKCGMADAAALSGVSLSYDTSYQVVSYPQGKLIKRFEIISPVYHADGLINLCKLKTHGFMSMTGAIKNCFGVIPGLTKPGYHAKLQKKALFAGMLLDLAYYVSPRLSIMDAVIGMEGEGPNAGNPRHLGWLLASANPLALDIVAGEIMGLDRKNNPVLMEAEKRGIIPNRLEDIELVGAKKTDLRVQDFKLPSTVLRETGNRLLAIVSPLMRQSFSMRPVIIEDKCTACGTCRDACPVHVITIENKVAKIDNKNCIRCYCCHEMCQHDAITLQGGTIYRMFNKTTHEL
ncbi:DUF362 domain-containing protein [candidate division KSB1 bacterium]|nr:DUF362 domain-containing protein [candidate division KSB1 bacterium]